MRVSSLATLLVEFACSGVWQHCIWTFPTLDSSCLTVGHRAQLQHSSSSCLVRITCTSDDVQLGRSIHCIFALNRKPEQQTEMHVDGKYEQKKYLVRSATRCCNITSMVSDAKKIVSWLNWVYCRYEGLCMNNIIWLNVHHENRKQMLVMTQSKFLLDVYK
jgi:hypothetical protein